MRMIYWVAAITFMLDQVTKYIVVHAMNLREVGFIDVWSPLLTFRMAWNYGINFGLLSGDSAATRWVLITIALAIVVGVTIWQHRQPGRVLERLSAGLLIGGALGNVIDRILYGAVADFLNMSCCGFDNPYAFNVADITIFAGAIGLVLFSSEKKPS